MTRPPWTPPVAGGPGTAPETAPPPFDVDGGSSDELPPQPAR